MVQAKKRDFFGPSNGTSDSEGHFESLKWPHFVIFKGFISKFPATFTAQGHW
jgi:hypothetical protein